MGRNINTREEQSGQGRRCRWRALDSQTQVTSPELGHGKKLRQGIESEVRSGTATSLRVFLYQVPVTLRMQGNKLGLTSQGSELQKSRLKTASPSPTLIHSVSWSPSVNFSGLLVSCLLCEGRMLHLVFSEISSIFDRYEVIPVFPNPCSPWKMDLLSVKFGKVFKT